jgi:hypothetical protein
MFGGEMLANQEIFSSLNQEMPLCVACASVVNLVFNA